MKRTLLLVLLTTLSVLNFNSIAQQSCSFIIHVDGISGTDDVACGAEGTPCATITYGIDRAVTESYTDVRISASTYSEIVELVDGVSLWGGFDVQWAVSGVTTITGGLAGNGEFYTVRANAISTPTVLSDLEIIAPDATTPGKSSYGVHVTNSTALTLQRVTVRGGAGADGAPGTNGTNATAPAANGQNGGNADEFNTSCNDDQSGAGGAGVGTGNRKGGNGGRGGYMDDDCSGFPDLDATGGANGANATDFATNGYGYRGNGGGTCANGGNANHGQTVHGAGGTGATSSANVVGAFWSALAGVNGTLGQDGTGGGGGGGSGGCDDGTDSYGAGGGGGGEGGLKAPTVGAGGFSGGNSAAVFMLTSTCNFIDCNFFIGAGGNGAAGGNAGTGSAGGIGGNGGNGAGDSGPGGKGGNGGAGGNSGAGGGGAGGFAYGIYASNSTVNRTGSTFNSGVGGQPGAGGTGIPSGVVATDGIGASSLDIAGTVTDNVGVLALEEDPCIEITTVDLTTVTYCAGDTITIEYTAIGSFSGTNTFTAQLSDAAGDFTSPTDIGSLVSDVSGYVTVVIPTTAVGTAYRIRVVSSATPAIGMENATDIVINALPTVVANASAQTVCGGSEVILTGSGADLYTWNNNITDGVAFAPAQSGYYTVYGVNATTLCANADSVEITVVGLPDTSVVQNGNELGAVLAGATYQWLDCDDNYAIISGAEAQTYAAPNSGNYAVIVTLNTCSDTSSCHNVIAVGVEEAMEAENVLIVYPNPSTGVLQTLTNVQNPMEVTVFNAMGQIIYSRANVTSNEVIDLSGAANGLYSVRFHNKEVNLLRQVIIQK